MARHSAQDEVRRDCGPQPQRLRRASGRGRLRPRRPGRLGHKRRGSDLALLSRQESARRYERRATGSRTWSASRATGSTPACRRILTSKRRSRSETRSFLGTTRRNTTQYPRAVSTPQTPASSCAGTTASTGWGSSRRTPRIHRGSLPMIGSGETPTIPTLMATGSPTA